MLILATTYCTSRATLVQASTYCTSRATLIQASTYCTPWATLIQASTYCTPWATLIQASTYLDSGCSWNRARVFERQAFPWGLAVARGHWKLSLSRHKALFSVGTGYKKKRSMKYGEEAFSEGGMLVLFCFAVRQLENAVQISKQIIIHHHHHQSLNREGRWGTTDDFATSFLHFSLFSTALWDLPNSRPVHSLMLSSHLFLCQPCLLPPFTVPCKMVLARPDERES